MRKEKYKKGQITIVNLLAIVLVLLLYVTTFVPILEDLTPDFIVVMEASENPNADLILAIYYLVPLFLLIAIVMTALIYAIPKREGVDGYRP